ncbi:MFS general substrate transporter [Peniophora sp. CONT]|nr:MFS general substrate transporter [Peniophora sp. CONT]
MFLGMWLAALDSTIVLASYASVGDELKELKSMSWISTGYLLTQASSQPLYSKLSDIFGRKPCLLVAYTLFALGCLACGMARSMPELVMARMLAGMGGGGMTTVVTITMSDLVPLRSRGMWHGVGNIVWMGGSVIGAPLGGYMADTVGWRWSFFFQIPLAMLAFGTVGALLNIPGHRKVALEDKLRRIDFVGSFCLIATVASLLVTLDRGGDVGWSNVQTTIPFGIFVVFLIALIVTERNFAREPVIPGKTLTNPTYLVIYLSNMASRGTIISTTFYISLYIRAVSGKTAAQAGTALLPSIIGGLMGSLAGGRYTQATGRFKKITVMLNAGMMLGSLFIALFTGVLGHFYIALELGFFLVSIANGCAMNTTLVSLVAEAGPEEQAVASGVLYLFRSLGSVCFLSISSTIFQDTLRRLLQRGLSGYDMDDVEKIVGKVREALSNIEELDAETRSVVHDAYGKSLQVIFGFCLVLAVCAFLTSVFLKDRVLASHGVRARG